MEAFHLTAGCKTWLLLWGAFSMLSCALTTPSFLYEKLQSQRWMLMIQIIEFK